MFQLARGVSRGCRDVTGSGKNSPIGSRGSTKRFSHWLILLWRYLGNRWPIKTCFVCCEEPALLGLGITKRAVLSIRTVISIRMESQNMLGSRSGQHTDGGLPRNPP